MPRYILTIDYTVFALLFNSSARICFATIRYYYLFRKIQVLINMIVNNRANKYILINMFLPFAFIYTKNFSQKNFYFQKELVLKLNLNLWFNY